MLLVLQFRKWLSGAHEVWVLSKKLTKFGVEYDDIVIANVLSDYWSIDRLLHAVKAARGVVLGGSGAHGFYSLEKGGTAAREFRDILDKSGPVIEEILKSNKPALGICFGIQLLGWFLGGKVDTNKSVEEVGYFKTYLTTEGEKDALFKGIPQEFWASYGHKSAVTAVPDNTKWGQVVKLARTDKVEYAAFRVANFWAVQFHPELNYEETMERVKLGGGSYIVGQMPKQEELTPLVDEQVVKNWVDVIKRGV